MLGQASFRWALFVGLVTCWVIGMSCSGGETPTEPAGNDGGTVEAAPEPAPREEPPKELGPEKGTPPQGLGESCQPTPVSQQGTCPSKGLLCGAVSDSESVCFENCSANECTSDGEKCISVDEVNSRFPICVKVVNAGESCDLKARTICRRAAADPPEFCISGKCTARPKDGWSLGDQCTPAAGNPQSDCKTGLVCTEHAKDEYRCAQKCDKDEDCPGDEVCGTDLGNQKACVIIAKIGEECSPSKRRFCRTTDPNNPVNCRGGKCEGTIDVKGVDEKCTKPITPGEFRGDCDKGLACLGVSRLESKCHKDCTQPSDCPTGESCMTHPNEGPGDPRKVCVKAVKDGETCDLTKRLLCAQPTGRFFKCDRAEKQDGTFEDEGKCVEIKQGSACKSDRDCGSMICVPTGGQNAPGAKHCMLPCDLQTNPCPNKAACQSFGQNGPNACYPVGPIKRDQACGRSAPQEGVDLPVDKFCEGGLACIGGQGEPQGACMLIAPCNSTQCETGYTCLQVGQTAYACALDCSKDANACSKATGTSCKTAGNVKICLP